jgi:hypothetical protein
MAKQQRTDAEQACTGLTRKQQAAMQYDKQPEGLLLGGRTSKASYGIDVVHRYSDNRRAL